MVGTGHLDGLAQFYTTTIDFDVELLGDGVGHQRSSDGTEEHALLAHLGDNAHGASFSFSARALASAMRVSSRLAMFFLRSSSCFRLPGVAFTA